MGREKFTGQSSTATIQNDKQPTLASQILRQPENKFLGQKEDRMSGVKLYRREDQDFSFKGDSSVKGYVPASYLAFANAGNSDTMGGGLAVFGAGSHLETKIDNDELLFIHTGQLDIKIGNEIFQAGPGDTLWIPKDTSLTYIAEEDVWFFFAVYPFSGSPAASVTKAYPDTPPRPA